MMGSTVVNPSCPQEMYARSISEISSCFWGPRLWHIEIRHRVKKTSTIISFRFETLELKIRRLKLWKPTACKNSEPQGLEDNAYHELLKTDRATITMTITTSITITIIIIIIISSSSVIFIIIIINLPQRTLSVCTS